jgi:hypothetical protein
MGLDMYMSERVSASHLAEPIVIDGRQVASIEFELGYWRKAYHIDEWLSERCDDDGYAPHEVLAELPRVCVKVMQVAKIVPGKVSYGYSIGRDGERLHDWHDGKVIENWEEIEALLPIGYAKIEGIFDYNEYYIEQVEYTIKVLDAAMQARGSVYYSAS